MNLPTRLLSTAESDLASCAAFIQHDSTEAAIRFLDAFDTTIKLLEHSPEVGGFCRFSNPLLEGMRVWTITGLKNYLIFYRIQPNEIEVVRVLHAARDLETIFGESDL